MSQLVNLVESVSVGDVVCLANTSDPNAVVRATTAHLQVAGAVRGVMIEAGSAGQTKSMAGAGDMVAASTSGIGTSSGTCAFAVVSGTATLQRMTTLIGGEWLVGTVDQQGNVAVAPACRQVAKPIVHVNDPKYGAKGDGVDDTAAIKAAILDAGYGGTVVFGAIPGKVATVYAVADSLDLGISIANGPQWGLLFIVEGSHTQNDSYSVSIKPNVKDWHGTSCTIVSKTGSMLRVSIPQAQWVANGDGNTYADPAKVENLPFEMLRASANAMNDYFVVSRVVNDNRDGGGAIILDLHDLGGTLAGSDAFSGSIDWRVWRHVWGVYSRRIQFVNMTLLGDTSTDVSIGWDTTESTVPGFVTNTDNKWIGCGYSNAAFGKLRYGIMKGRAILARPGNPAFRDGAVTPAVRADTTTYGVGTQKGPTVRTGLIGEILTGDNGTTGTGEPAAFTSSSTAWGTRVTDNFATWTMVYEGATPRGSQVARANNTAYVVNDVRFSSSTAGQKRKRRFRCIIAGTSHLTTEPTAFTASNTQAGDKIVDNTVTWICEDDAGPPISRYPYQVDYQRMYGCDFKYCIAGVLVDNITGQCRDHVYEDFTTNFCNFAIATPHDIKPSLAGRGFYCQVKWKRGGAGGNYDGLVYAPGGNGWQLELESLHCESGGRIVWGGYGPPIKIEGCHFEWGGASKDTHFKHRIAILTASTDVSIKRTSIYFFDNAADWTPIALQSPTATGTTGVQRVNLEHCDVHTSNRRGTPAQKRAARREPYRCADGDTMPIKYTGASGGAYASGTFTPTLKTANCVDITRATAAEIAAAFNSTTMTANSSTEMITHTSWDLPTGTPVTIVSSAGASGMPLPLVAGTTYWTVRQTGTMSKLAPTVGDAINGTNLINITSNGSGTLTLTQLQVRFLADGWGFLWWASYACGATGVATNGDVVAVNAGNVTTAIGGTSSSQGYIEQKIGRASTHIVTDDPTGNAAANSDSTNRTLDIIPGLLRIANGSYTGWRRCHQEFIGSGMPAGGDWGEFHETLALTSQQAAPVRNTGGRLTFSGLQTSRPIGFKQKEDDTSYDVAFDPAPLAVTGTPVAGKPVVVDAGKSVLGCRADRVDGNGTLVAAGVGNSETYAYEVRRRRDPSWTPQSVTNLVLKAWLDNASIVGGAVASIANSATGTNPASAFAQSTGANQPIGAVGTGPRGCNKITFDGTRDFLTATITTPYAQPFVIVMALKFLGATGAVFDGIKTTCSVQYAVGTNIVTTSAGTAQASGGFTNQGTEHVLTFYVDNTTYQTKRAWLLRKNGTTIGAGFASINTNSLDGITIGALKTPNTWGNFELYELMVATVAPGAIWADILDDISRYETWARNLIGV